MSYAHQDERPDQDALDIEANEPRVAALVAAITAEDDRPTPKPTGYTILETPHEYKRGCPLLVFRNVQGRWRVTSLVRLADAHFKQFVRVMNEHGGRFHAASSTWTVPLDSGQRLSYDLGRYFDIEVRDAR